MKSRVHPCLRFDRNAEEAAVFHVGVFPNARIGAITRHGAGAPLSQGTVLDIAALQRAFEPTHPADPENAP